MRINFLLFSLALLSPLHAQRPDRGWNNSPPAELKNFTFQEKSFKSEAIGQDAKYGIYLPKGYDDPANAKTTYPLVIWLHGLNEDHMRFHSHGFGATVLDKVVSDGKLPPCIFVLPFDGTRHSMWLDRGKGSDTEGFITKDLLEHVTSTYRVSKERGERALMGISMGGMGALRIGFTKPELFGTIAVHSSAVLPDDPTKLSGRMKQMAEGMGLADPDKWKLVNPLNLAEDADAKKLQGLHLYFDAGTNDRYEFAEPNQKMHEALEKKKIEHTFVLVPGGGHAWGSGFQEDSLIRSLTFVGEDFKAAQSKAKGKGDKADAKADKKTAEPGKD